MTKSEFFETVAPVIIKEATARGYKFPSAIIAQAACESNWGKSSLSAKYHNYFGMKCGSKWKGKSVNMKTKEEYTTGKLTSIRDNFRAYDTLEEGIKGYFEFINCTRYKNLKIATSYKDYIKKLKEDGWATSSTYISTLTKLVEGNNLDKYDKGTPVEYVEKKENKSIEKIAEEVIAGKWGNGLCRKQRLEQAGYDWSTVQGMVNKILRYR